MNTWQLSERGMICHKEKPGEISIINNVVVIKGDKKRKDNTIRSIRIHTKKSIIERPIQLLYPMELHCDSKSNTSKTQDDKTLNVIAEKVRPKRSTALAKQRIRDFAGNENQSKINVWRTMWKSQGHFDELVLGRESIQCNIICV